MIKSNKPLIVQIDARSGRTIEAIVFIKIKEVRLIAGSQSYKVDIEDTILGSPILIKSVDIPINSYEALRSQIVTQTGFTETGTALDLKIMPYALLSFIKNDVREDGKLIYGAAPEDFELNIVEEPTPDTQE